MPTEPNLDPATLRWAADKVRKNFKFQLMVGGADEAVPWVEVANGVSLAIAGVLDAQVSKPA